ncbi:MAG TPA: pyruvate kinase [Candidatus Limnocylindrales bacterium]|nr:pyruvate kinase [Candidatus Limnocylindrales bacterium]
MTSPARPRAATKLVCTIGPATETRLGELVDAGMSVARLNFAHGTASEHTTRVGAIREVARAAGRHVAILADLPGPKVRLGPLRDGQATLREGSTFTFFAGLDALDDEGDETRAATTHAGLAADLRPGDRIHLSDGAVEVVVRAIVGNAVTAVVERGGTVRSRAGVNVPADRLSLPALGDHDRELARLAMDLGIDLVGQSFVRTAADVEDLRALLGPDGPAIIAKIETRSAVDEFASVARAAQGVMVARGDLGLELPFEAVPLVQKRLVRTAVAMGKPVIVATQMLESMIGAARPTRAEASDVANAVLDGADAVMLSGETAIGAYPILAAEAAQRIAAAAEGGDQPERTDHDVTDASPAGRGGALAVAAVALAEHDRSITVLVAAGRHAGGAVVAAARRPAVPIVAVVPDERMARLLAVVRGVWPVVPADAALTADPGGVPADVLLMDPSVAAMLPAGGRAVVLAGSEDGTVERIEALAIPTRG